MLKVPLSGLDWPNFWWKLRRVGPPLLMLGFSALLLFKPSAAHTFLGSFAVHGGVKLALVATVIMSAFVSVWRACFDDHRYWNIRCLKQVAQTLFVGPPLVALLVFLILAFFQQIAEVYLGIIEAADLLRGILGLAGLLLLSAMLFCWQYVVSRKTVNELYLEHGDVRYDRMLATLTRGAALLCGSLPVLGLVIGLFSLWVSIGDSHVNFSHAFRDLKPTGQPNEFDAGIAALPGLQGRAFAVFAVVTAIQVSVTLWLMMLLERSHEARLVVTGLAIAVFAVALMPLALSGWTVAVSQAFGPLAVLTSVLISAVTVLTGLSVVSRLVNLPVTGILIAIGCLFAWQKIAPAQFQVDDRNRGLTKDAKSTILDNEFQTWLKARQGYSPTGPRYPVFVVAAQGGGIYAASAAAAFLSAMQDACPAFAQHVFTVSGVSGGAVGASIFTGLIRHTMAGQVDDCSPVAPKNAVGSRTHEVIESDHLSPVMAQIVPDLARKLSFFEQTDPFDRANALEASFAGAFARRFDGPIKMVKDCVKPEQPWSANALLDSYANHWCSSMPAPSLVLNTTWVETGYRLAFSPYTLRGIGDGTLYSFSNLRAQPFVEGGLGNIDKTLIGAAIVSARFPGVVPAWSLKPKIKTSSGTQERHWNFVDGGYAEGSGASTALDIYNAIQKFAKPSATNSRDLNIDPYLILLTDAESQDLSDIHGSGFSDTLVPLTALLTVRELLAKRAVTQAITQLTSSVEPPIAPDDVEAAVAARLAKVPPVLTIRLDSKAFPLPLGWKISKATNMAVRMQLGDPNLCDTDEKILKDRMLRAIADFRVETSQEIASNRALRVINDNSCVKSHLLSLLRRPASAPSQ